MDRSGVYADPAAAGVIRESLCLTPAGSACLTHAQAFIDAIGDLGIEVRAGLHAGECESVGDDLVGLAVHIGARVGAQAQAGEVWVSRTVCDLVAGSGMRFTRAEPTN